MSKSKKMSPKTKKTLMGVGVGFGTVVLFCVSFGLSLYFMINPIQMGSPQIEKENAELKEQIESLQSEIDGLDSEKDSSKGSGNSGNTQHTEPPSNGSTQSGPATTTTPSGSSSQSGGTETSTPPSNALPNPEPQPDVTENETTEGENTSGGTESGSFTPDTVVTPEEGITNEADTDITVIEIIE